MAALTIKFLKAEFCRFEENYKDLKVRVKIDSVWNVSEDNIFTAKIITDITDPGNTSSKLEYEITDWTETIIETTTKLVKTYDLNLVTFLDGKLPLNIGTHTLEVNINDTTESSAFKVVPVTVQSMKNQYLLGVELQSSVELAFQQDLRLITGVEILQISQDTSVGSKELVWNFTDKTLQWDNGEPVVISDIYSEYILLDMMATPGIVGGDYLKIQIDDIDELPAEDQIETAVVDVKQYSIEDFQYWINIGYQVVAETVIMTDIEPTLYSSDKDLGYKYLDPVMDIPKSYSESSNYSLDFPINMLQFIEDLWAQYFGSESRIAI